MTEVSNLRDNLEILQLRTEVSHLEGLPGNTEVQDRGQSLGELPEILRLKTEVGNL